MALCSLCKLPEDSFEHHKLLAKGLREHALEGTDVMGLMGLKGPDPNELLCPVAGCKRAEPGHGFNRKNDQSRHARAHMSKSEKKAKKPRKAKVAA